MKHNPILRQKVLENCRGYKKQFQENNLPIRTWAKISPEILYNLLEDVTGPNKSRAKSLLEDMSCSPWSITATAHEGGIGDHLRSPDRFLHITLRVIRTHHLRCKESSSQGLYIFDITE